MIPALAIIGIGRDRRIPIPIPIFLLWPFVAIAIALVLGLSLFVPRRTDAGRGLLAAGIALRTLFHLSGLQVDVARRSGESFRLRLV